MTSSELNEKRLAFFQTVLKAIADLSDVMGPKAISKMAKDALDEPFCASCGTHPALSGCSSCGRDFCDNCAPPGLDECKFCRQLEEQHRSPS